MAHGHGGKRAGAGGRRGTKRPATIAKVAAREALRHIVLRDMDALVAAQIAHAKGVKYLVIRDRRTGTFARVTEPFARETSVHEEILEVWEKDPSVQAFTDLMNRAMDKPKEQAQEIQVSGVDDLVAKLLAGRQRAATRAAQQTPPDAATGAGAPATLRRTPGARATRAP